MMCGLFGMVLPHEYPNTVPVGSGLRFLGICAEERGHDAAGVSVLDRGGVWTTRRTLGSFRRLYTHQRGRNLDRLLWDAVLALGHTRWATQGGHGLECASPIAAGSLLCTHNGDLDPASITGPVNTLPELLGSLHGPMDELVDSTATDSHRLFWAIAAVTTRRRGLTRHLVEVLSGMRGRAALAWTDTTRTDRRVWLARSGLSPLAVGVDQHGGLWWASNPGWLRELGEFTGLRLTITLLAEGSLWSVVPHQHRVSCTLLAEFKPTVRRRDEAIARVAVWRGFSTKDLAGDRALLRHRTVG